MSLWSRPISVPSGILIHPAINGLQIEGCIHFGATVCKTVCPVLSDHCLSLHVCLCVTLVYSWMDQDETWHAGRPRPWPHCWMGWVYPAPLLQRDTAPNFRPFCGHMAGWIKMPLGMEVGLCPADFVLDVDPAPTSAKRRQSPEFSAHVYCGQTAGWMNTPLGTEVDLIPGHIELFGDPASPLRKGHSSPHLFGACLLWPRSPISTIVLLLGKELVSIQHKVAWVYQRIPTAYTNWHLGPSSRLATKAIGQNWGLCVSLFKG